MFDTFLVHKNIILPLIESEPDLKNYWNSEEYIHFQTKDLVNALSIYKVDENNKVWVEVHKYEVDPTEKWGVSTTRLPDEFCDNVTAKIELYDYLENVNGYNISVDFEGIIIKGLLTEINLIKIDKTSHEELVRKNKAIQERWENIRGTRSWKTKTAIENVERKIRKLVSPVWKTYQSYLRKLAKDAESQYPENPEK